MLSVIPSQLAQTCNTEVPSACGVLCCTYFRVFLFLHKLCYVFFSNVYSQKRKIGSPVWLKRDRTDCWC